MEGLESAGDYAASELETLPELDLPAAVRRVPAIRASKSPDQETYPWLIHRLTYRRTNHENLHVRG
ncbi:MAG: hypothetical protein WBW78_02545 [Terrimicrobiaceae bacterium]